ncbi:MAG TPA: glycoside hydrolase family 2 TIM barrel-domain containing protein [Streptosporangiaceae bacterium]|nr:glycoside hydrolase family 2 TIM barrel-domain containing protein [Streptosporangiaceae bacterium]
MNDGPAAGGAFSAARPSSGTGSSFSTGWLFGGEYTPGAERAAYDDSAFTPVTLPHTVTPLSWGGWNPATWQKVWIYRRHFDGTPARGSRVFADFDGVMAAAVAVLNDQPAGTHQGGYLPWSVELTRHVVPGDNVLAVVVDSRCLPVPPLAPGCGPDSIDFLQPGGIYREAALRVVPQVFLADVFACPADVLTAGRRVDVQVTIDAAAAPDSPAEVTAELLDGPRRLAAATRTVRLRTGTTATSMSLTGLGQITLWSPDTPKLYTVRTTLSAPGAGTHTLSRRVGFREASFRPDGFYLNGERLTIFGLNRHQLFPYLGMAAPGRLQRRDAEILRHELNCTMVRCSHYPQSPHFLDACDELGLMVWEEAPGWQHVGGEAWQDLVIRNVRDMVIRDRSRPSVIIWGTRLNETADHPALYARTRQLAHQLDGSRPTTGAILSHSTNGWAEDVFSFDDYHSRNGHAELLPPLPGVPYLVSEAVGALSGPPAYRWTDPGPVLAAQAALHAEVHDIARSDPRYAGLLGWAAIDYASLNGGKRIWRALKTPGVLDIFRVPKPGAAFYQSQADPAARPVILPAFCWGPGPGGPEPPGAGAMIFTNCDRLEIYAGGRHVATGTPDTRRFGRLACPPAVVDLTGARTGNRTPMLPELRIDGYLGGRRAATMFMSADTSRDRLELTADHSAIEADGSDATRITFRAVDAYGNHRRGVTGDVTLTLTGPAVLIGDNPFPFGAYGGVGGAFVRSLPGQAGLARITAGHPALGRATVQVTITPRP